MKQYNREKNKLRPYISSHKIILRNNKKEFKKIYLGKKSNFSTKKVIKNEYFKTLKAHKLGISPKPLSYKDTELIIKYLPIKKNFKQLIEQNKLTNKLILSLAKKIAILHKNNIIHEDLSFTNVVLDTNNKLFIIDFSPGYFGRGNAGRYSDLGAIIASLRYFKPLYKPHLFFKMKKYNEFAKIFLKEYIKNYG
ncbi:MAG: RIO1 family regulatory kinase/ATPase, partial [Candidatus Woesearchaeota archaeon]